MRRGFALEGSLLLAFAAALGLAVRAHPGPSPVDRWWADRMVQMRGPVLTFFAREVFNRIGRFPWSWIVVALAAVALWRSTRKAAVAVLLIGELASWGTNSLLKVLIDRPRPPGALITPPTSSYPSGHTAFAAVTAVLLLALFTQPGRRRGWVVAASLLALGMAWSRTYLMAHWLTDVVGGLAVGTGVALLTLAFPWGEPRPEAPTEGRG
jgi:membrane-associated phospholipid phosphatase